MKFFSATAFALFFLSGPAFAEPNNFKKQTIEPCAWWTYEFDINGYVCRRTLPAMTVYSAAEVDKTVDGLKQIISSLEMRVKILEEKVNP